MRGADLELAMRAVAGRQHGVASRRQVRELTSSREAVRSRLRSPGWETPTPNVVRLAGSSDSFPQRCMTAVLDVGREVFASRTTAAALWGLPGFSPGVVHVTRPIDASSRTSALATVHESRYLPEHHTAVHNGVPITTVARTLFDLAGSLHPGRIERAVENALRHHFVALEDLRRVTIELLARGRTGSRLMRELLHARGVGYIPPASGLEATFLALIIAAGMELPEGQVDLGGEGWIGRVDFYYRRQRLVIETDSDLYHTAKLDAESDERRDIALRAAGFEVLRIRENLIRGHPEAVVAAVRTALGSPSLLTPPAVAIATAHGFRTR